ncbi:hypothetical protein [Streptomyces sp. NPDC002463]|uniref:hypothetical protein n=1 Tax=Streptomyces sp. NPDC002463 TaxID=3364645 RepID=UPI003680E0D2
METVRQDLVHAGLAPAEEIPTVNEQMVHFKSDKLEKIPGAAHPLDVLGNWLPVLTVVLGAIGMLLARRRRRALVTTALGAAGASIVLVIGPVIAVVALGVYLSGTGRLPRAVRGKADGMADSAARWGGAHGVHTARVGTWTETYRRWIALGVVLVLSLVLALWSYPTVRTVLLLVLILLSVLAHSWPPPAGPASRPDPPTTLTGSSCRQRRPLRPSRVAGCC